MAYQQYIYKIKCISIWDYSKQPEFETMKKLWDGREKRKCRLKGFSYQQKYYLIKKKYFV